MSGGDQPPAIFWFRDDLRIADNPGLASAADTRRPLILLYVLDDTGDGDRPLGGASRWWLHHSLEGLSKALLSKGQRLTFLGGQARLIVPQVAAQAGASTVFWNRRYGKAAKLDIDVAARLAEVGCSCSTFSASLLYEPESIRTREGQPFKTYSAFWRSARSSGRPRPPVAAPRALPPPPKWRSDGLPATFDVSPRTPGWAEGIRDAWTPGEPAAHRKLDRFLHGPLADYHERRDFPGDGATSMLSPHLRFGEISPVQIIDALDRRRTGAGKFEAELGWRDFAYHTLDQAPGMAGENLRTEFDRFPWKEAEPAILEAWQTGTTGYPIVDAAMRQLWRTGWMHNRARMLVASFLTKHLLIDWRHGERWFWDTLVDADAANNPFGWQWVAGSGFDAQPYFRIFNPVIQGERFDPRGTYVRRFVPEISGLPDRLIHRPWDASPAVLAAADVQLGSDYPRPIVEHAAARSRALAAYRSMRGS